MGDAKALEEALNGSRLKPMVSAAPPLEWAYIASVFKAISQRSSDHCSEKTKMIRDSGESIPLRISC